RINAFAASYPDAVFSAVIWVQGEDEGAASAQWSQAQYATALDSMIAALRLDAPAISATPFIAVEIGAGDDGLTPTGSQIRAAIRDTPNRVANTLFVSASGLFETVDTLDPLHFGPNGQRGMGQRIYNAMAGEVAAYGGVN
uniref:sialate O-acetylesterase n=1 Tax=Pelagimonas sp. TaxID=2073170 RepID=UPI003D6B0B53